MFSIKLDSNQESVRCLYKREITLPTPNAKSSEFRKNKWFTIDELLNDPEFMKRGAAIVRYLQANLDKYPYSTDLEVEEE